MRLGTIRNSHVAAAIGASVVTVLILWLRLPGQFAHPQFWAEDSTVFWFDQYQYGSAALFYPYAGTMQTAPRLIAFISSFFDPAKAPRAFSLGASLMIAWAAATAAGAMANPRLGFLLGAALAAIPYSGDQVLGNATNVQWALAPVLALLVVSDRQPDRLLTINNTAFALIAATTGPFSIVLAPLAIVRYIKYKDLLSHTIGWTGIFQYIVLGLNYPRSEETSDGSFWHLIDMLIQRGMPPTSINVLSCGVLIALSLSASDGRWRRAGLLFAGFGFLAATAFKFRHNANVFDAATSPRYFYPFQVCIWWCAISLLFVSGRQSVGAMWLAYSIATYPTGYFRFPPLNNIRWADNIRELGKATLEFPVNPAGWTIKIRPR